MKFLLASFVHAVGFRYAHCVANLSFMYLPSSDSHQRRRWLTYATNHPFVVEVLISEQEVDIEGMGSDAVGRAIECASFLLVAVDVGECECHRLSV